MSHFVLSSLVQLYTAEVQVVLEFITEINMFYSSRSCMQLVAFCYFCNGHTTGCFVVFLRVGLLKRLLFVLHDLNEMVN